MKKFFNKSVLFFLIAIKLTYSISSGNYTVGSGGNYNTWYDAIAATTNLTGNLTFTQISATTETSSILIDQDLCGFILTLTSNLNHSGNPSGGYKTNWNVNNHFFNIQCEGPGTLIIEKLNIYRQYDLTGYYNCLRISTITAECMIYIRNNLINLREGLGYGIVIIDADPLLYIYNNVVWGGYENIWLLAINSSSVVENNTWWGATTYGCDVGGLNCIWNNNLSIGNGADFYGTNAATGTNNASNDSSALNSKWNSGSGNIINIITINEVLSTNDTLSSFLDIKTGGSIINGGKIYLVSGNNMDIRTRLRPHGLNYSIGASEGISSIKHITDKVYSSSIDPINLYYDISYDSTLSNKPVVVLMHGFNDTKSSITSEWKERIISHYGIVALIPDMRGRGISEGSEDVNAREIFDIYDAITHVKSNYSNFVDSTNINIIGYSGGGGSSLKIVCAFPDMFGVGASFFGVSDYGYDSADGWYNNTTSGIKTLLNSWIGGIPTVVPDAYYSRGANFFLKNASYGRVRVYHDTEDTDVKFVNLRNVRDTIVGYSYNNWIFDSSMVGSTTRWLHGYPVLNTGGENNIQAEDSLYGNINSGLYKTQKINKLDTFYIPGFIKTKKYHVWLDSGYRDVGTIIHDTLKDVYKIYNNRITLNNNIPVNFKLLNESSNYPFSIKTGSVNTFIRINSFGILDTTLYLNANDSMIIKPVFLDSISPLKGKVNTLLNIYFRGDLDSSAGIFVKANNVNLSPITKWSNNKIIAKIPASVSQGTYTIWFGYSVGSDTIRLDTAVAKYKNYKMEWH